METHLPNPIWQGLRVGTVPMVSSYVHLYISNIVPRKPYPLYHALPILLDGCETLSSSERLPIVHREYVSGIWIPMDTPNARSVSGSLKTTTFGASSPPHPSPTPLLACTRAPSRLPEVQRSYGFCRSPSSTWRNDGAMGGTKIMKEQEPGVPHNYMEDHRMFSDFQWVHQCKASI